jgi:hypothetical protein
MENAVVFFQLLDGIDVVNLILFLLCVILLVSKGNVSYTKGKGWSIGNKCSSCPKSKKVLLDEDFEVMISFYCQMFPQAYRRDIAYVIITKVKAEITRCLVRNHIEWDNDKFLHCYFRETAGSIHQIFRSNLQHECKTHRMEEPVFDEFVNMVRKIMERNR